MNGGSLLNSGGPPSCASIRLGTAPAVLLHTASLPADSADAGSSMVAGSGQREAAGHAASGLAGSLGRRRRATHQVLAGSNGWAPRTPSTSTSSPIELLPGRHAVDVAAAQDSAWGAGVVYTRGAGSSPVATTTDGQPSTGSSTSGATADTVARSNGAPGRSSSPGASASAGGGGGGGANSRVAPTVLHHALSAGPASAPARRGMNGAGSTTRSGGHEAATTTKPFKAASPAASTSFSTPCRQPGPQRHRSGPGRGQDAEQGELQRRDRQRRTGHTSTTSAGAQGATAIHTTGKRGPRSPHAPAPAQPASPEPRQPQQAQSSSTNGSGSKGSTARGRSGRHAAVASATVAAAAVGTGATAVATAFQPEAQSPQRSRQRRLGSREETPGEGDGGVAVLAVPEEAWVVERAGETDVTAQPSTSSSGSSSTGSAVRRNGRAIASYTDDLDDVTVALPLVREAAAAGLQSASGFGARPQRKRLLQLFPVPRPHRRKREALARAARAAALAAATAAAARQEADAGRAAAAVVDSRESLSAAPNGSGSIKRRRRGLHSTEAAAAAPSALDPGCSSPQDRSQVPGWSGAGRGHSGDGWADSWVDGAAAAGSFGGRPGRRRFSFPFTVSRTSDTPIRTLTPTRWLDPLRAATSGHSLSAATAQAARVPSAPPAEAAAPSAAAALAQRPAGSDDGTAAPAVSWDVATQAAPAAAVAESSAGSLTPPPALVELEQAAAPTARRRPSTSAASLAAVPFELPSASAAVRQPYALAVKPPYVLYAVESPGHRYVVYR